MDSKEASRTHRRNKERRGLQGRDDDNIVLSCVVPVPSPHEEQTLPASSPRQEALARDHSSKLAPSPTVPWEYDLYF